MKKSPQAGERICDALDTLCISTTEQKMAERDNKGVIHLMFNRGTVKSLATRSTRTRPAGDAPLLEYELPEAAKTLTSSMSLPVLMDFSVSNGHVFSINLALNDSKLAKAVRTLVFNSGRIKVLVDAANSMAMINAFETYLSGRKDPLSEFCPEGLDNILAYEASRFIANPMPQRLLGFCVSPVFTSLREYAIIGLCQVELDQDPEVQQILAYEGSPKKLILLNYKGGDLVKEYEGLITRPKEGEFRLQSGDRFEFQFGHTGWSSNAASWRATVLPRGTVKKEEMMSVIVHRGQYKSSLQYAGDSPNAIDATKLKREELQKRTLQTPGNMVIVKIVDCKNAFTNIRTAYLRLITSVSAAVFPYRNRVSQVLLGLRPDLLEYKDLYSQIRQEMPDLQRYMMHLNDRQTDVVQAAGHIRGGFQFVQGPPGTGKTYTLQNLAIPFLAAPKQTLLLVVAPTNHGADDLARGMYDGLTSLRQRVPEVNAKKPYILRAHPEKAEDQITRTQGPKPARNPVEAGKPEKQASNTSSDMDFERRLLDEFVSADKPKFEGVYDKRVSHIDYSIGYMKLLVSGVVPGSEYACSDTAIYATFRKLYDKQAHGKRLTAEEEKTWKTESDKLTKVVLQGASGIVSTTATISQAGLLGHIEDRVAAVFMDENAFERESNLVPLFAANFSLDPCFVIIGDQQQLAPLTKAEEEDNAFKPQLEISFMARMIDVGMEYIMLTEQHRMVSNISEIANALTYRGQLIDDPCTQLSERHIARKFRDLMQKHYGIETNRLIIDLPPSKSNVAPKNGRSSKSNEYSICIVAELVKCLLQEFESEADIAVLTPYGAQRNSYVRLEGNMRDAKLKNFVKVTFDTLDGAQGRQFDIVVLDLVVGESAGFLESENRLNVAMTRAKNGLIVVCSREMIQSAYYKKPCPTPYMKRMLRFLEGSTWTRERDDNYPETAFYLPCAPNEPVKTRNEHPEQPDGRNNDDTR